MKSFYKENFFEEYLFKKIKKIVLDECSSFSRFDYSNEHGRFGKVIDLDPELEKEILNKIKKECNVEDLDVTYIQIVKYQIVDGMLPKLIRHTDDLPCTMIVDLCIETSVSNWGLQVEDRLFVDKENSCVFLFGNEESHFRPEYPSQNMDDYAILMFINLAPKDFWFFKNNLKKYASKIKYTPVMIERKENEQRTTN